MQHERRRPRASFTRTLEKICARLDETATLDLTWKERLLRNKPFSGKVRIETLWVAGSYARGAPDCGDLDLVMHIALLEGQMPNTSLVTKLAFGTFPDVRVYQGTPKQNASQIEFPESVLIWDRGGDWKERIASIRVDPEAARFARPHDSLPFRMEQFSVNVDIEHVEELLQKRVDELLDWRFTPIAELTPVEPQSKDERRVAEVVVNGAKSKKLIPYLLAYLGQPGRWPKPAYRSDYVPGETVLRMGGARVFYGRPRLPLSFLDELGTSSLVLIPHFTARGPNGIWEIFRGPKHPLELAVADLVRYCHVESDGKPSIIHMYYGDCGSSAPILEIYVDAEDARHDAQLFYEDDNSEDKELLQVRALTGHELLEVLAMVEGASVGDTVIALTRAAKEALRVDAIDTNESALEKLRVAKGVRYSRSLSDEEAAPED